MATINEPTNIDNNTANSGAGLETRLETLWQNDQALNAELETKANVATLDERTEIQTGTGFAPSGTPVKMSYFEGTTDSNEICTVNHSLGSNIIAISAFINDTSGRWSQMVQTITYDQRVWFDASFLRFQINSGLSALFVSKPVRFLVWHK